MFQQLVFCELQLSFHVKIVGARCAMGPMSKKKLLVELQHDAGDDALVLT
jgi:hypothetical protein